MRGAHDLAQPHGAEARREAGDGIVTGRDNLLQRRGERPLAEPFCLGLVQHAEARVHAGGHRMRREQAPAEPVHGGDPGPLALARGARDLSRPVVLPGLGCRARPGGELAPDPLAKLPRRSLGEREGEDCIGTDPILGHRVAVALDEDPGLTGARPRLREHVAGARRDRRSLLGGGLARGGGRQVVSGGAHPSPFPASPLPAASSTPIERSSRQIGW